MKIYSSVADVPLPDYDSQDSVAIKLHMGERGNKTFLRPGTVRTLVKRLKDMDCLPFLTDTTTLYQRKRYKAEDYLETAAMNGYTEKSIGCPIKIADVDGETKVGNIHVAKELLNADRLVVISHATGHISTGFAGAIKNVSMGCVGKRGKRYIHSAGWPRYDEEKCKQCGDCVEACPFGFLVLNDRIELNLKDCPACERCLNTCSTGALWRPEEAMEKCYRRYAETCSTVTSSFREPFFINELNRITKFCDCTTNPGPIISPDLGFIASSDPVELDRKTVELIVESNPEASQIFGEKWKNFIDIVSRNMPGK